MTTRIVQLKGKGYSVQNEIETQPITDSLFLEFGKRVGEKYRYVSLMVGNINYTGNKEAQQLYFTHFVSNRWRVLDDTCLKLVEDYSTKEQAVARLRQLAEQS